MTKIQLLQAQKINAMKQKIENKKSLIGRGRNRQPKKRIRKIGRKRKKSEIQI